jgi:thimet oligopeptidase
LAAGVFAFGSAGARVTLPIYESADKLTATCEAGLKRARGDVARLETVPLATVSTANTINGWNAMQMRIDDVRQPIDLYANVNEDEKIRAAADQCLAKFATLNTEIFQNEKLYQHIKAVKTSMPHQARLRKNLLDAFEDTGIALPPEKRTQVKDILDKLEALRQEFEKNLRDDRTKLVFTAAEIQGLPQPYLDNAKRDDKGNYLLGFDYPEYTPFINLAVSDEARKRYYIAFTNRGGKRNIEVLNEIMRLRLEMARLYGLPSYAHLAVRHKMVENPETVNAFLNDVAGAVRDAEIKTLNEIQVFKAHELGKKPDEVKVERWDVYAGGGSIGYYVEKIRRARFAVDQESLRKYFPMPAAIDYTMAVASELYGIKFQRANVPVWSKDVLYYDVLDAKTGKYLSGIYLDLYPRDGKFKHAAMWQVRSASRAAGRTPISALVTNFNREGLTHDELETLLHEFGHVLHGALSVADYVNDAGTNTVQDFVEAPSQMFEEWARRPEALALMQKVCSNCPVMDKDLIKRLNEARKYGLGVRYSRQWLYAAYDMALTSEAPGEAMEVWKKMESATPLGYVDGTMFPANFAHITNGSYGAGYYGYMWSEVLALDMLSAFGDNIMNPAVGRRFRDVVLAQGGQQPAKDLVRDFLGREPNSKAFFTEIIGQR